MAERKTSGADWWVMQRTVAEADSAEHQPFGRFRPKATSALDLGGPGSRDPPTVSGLDSGAGPVDDAQDLLLVVQHRTVIRYHTRRVMRGNGKGKILLPEIARP